MAIVRTDDTHYQAIADEIRLQRGNDNSKWLPETMPIGISTACMNQYNTGFSEGREDGFNEGMVAGKVEGKRLGKQEGKIELLQASKYMNATAIGSAVAVHDVSQVEHDVAVKVSSKNVLPYPYAHTTQTIKGITFTDNGNGSITVNGTATGIAMFYFAADWTTDGLKMLEDGETYYLKSYVSDNTAEISTVVQAVDKTTGSSEYYYSWNMPFIVEKDKYTYQLFRMQINTGVTVDNITVYPQLEKGTVATPYTPYVADVNGVEVKRYGKNLLKTTNYVKGTLDIATGGRSNNTEARSWCLITDYILLKQGSYILSNVTGANLRNICFYNLNKEYTSNIWTNRVTQFKFTVTEDCYMRVDIERANNTAIENFDTFLAEYQLQLECGDTATPYTPYIEPTVQTAAADGTVQGVKSLSPSMTLLSDAEGVALECSYLRDIDTYIDNLMVDVALTGGE